MASLIDNLPALVGVLVGAVATLVITRLADRARWRREQESRSDIRRAEAYAEHGRAIKHVHHLATSITAADRPGAQTQPIDSQSGLDQLAVADVELATAREGVPNEHENVVQRLKKRFGQDEYAIRRAGQLHDICQTQVAEIRSILRRAESESIKSAAREAHAKRPGGPGPRFHSLAEAERRGIDLDRLRSVQRSGRQRLDELMHGDGAFSPGELTVRSLEAPFDWPPNVKPPVAVSTVFLPPFAEGWERATISEATGDGSVPANESYLDPQWGRFGTRMVGRNHDADDSDWINVFHQSGFIVPVTMPSTSPLMITADLTCLVCEHRISTSDEWGWSDFYAVTQSGVLFAVFWERDDGEPMTEDFRQRFVPGLDASGDGESFPGMKVMVGPGERRSLNSLTDVAFPAGKTVWVYVGMSDFMYASLNDVSVDISMDSAWQLSSLTVTAL